VRLDDLHRLSGPNVFTTRPVSIGRLELDELTGKETTGFPGFAERLTMALPGLAGHHCTAGRPGGFTEAMARGTHFGHVTEHVALELSCLAGREARLGRTMWAGAEGRYDVMMECPQDEPPDSVVPEELLKVAMRIIKDLLAKRRPDFCADLRRIARMVDRERLGVSTAAIAAAARRRGIPVRRVGGLSMLRLGYGCHRRLACAALTEQTSGVGVDIASDKVLAMQLLAAAGIPVPDGVVVSSAQEAIRALETLGAPVVVKPRRGNHGRCVTVGVSTACQVAQAFAKASTASPEVIVEAFVAGTDYRILVIDGHVVAAAELRPNADLSTGRTSRDVTDRVHDDVAEMCRRAASASGLDICGVDVRLPDIRAPLLDPAGLPGASPRGAVIGLNARPGLRMHLSPTEGTGRDVAGAVVDRLYPPGAPSRIPLIAVTGTNGKTTTVAMIGHILHQAGLRVGMATTDGVYSGGRLVCAADASGPRSAEMVLEDTSVEAAVLETARGGILRRGLGYDKADVAVVTNISADHLGADGVHDLGDLADVKALPAEQVLPGGTIVLNADDGAAAALADRPAVRRAAPVIRYFSLFPGNPVIERHKKAGGITCELRDGQLTETEGGRQRTLISVAELPGAFGGRAPHVVANALAAVAACRAVGVSAKDIRNALATFIPAEANPGRGDIYEAAGCPVIVDYRHNAAALDATGRMIAAVWGGQAVAAVTLPGDRRDDLVMEMAQAIAAWFGRVVVYEDRDRRGRRPGEMRTLITAAMRRVRPDVVCEHAEGPEAALRAAVSLASGGRPVLFLYERLALARSALDAIGARPCPAAAMTAGREADVPDPASADAPDSGDLPALGAVHGRTSIPTAQLASVSPLTRPDRQAQWNRGHW
jgi:cyanophycin synthetase